MPGGFGAIPAAGPACPIPDSVARSGSPRARGSLSTATGLPETGQARPGRARAHANAGRLGVRPTITPRDPLRTCSGPLQGPAPPLFGVGGGRGQGRRRAGRDVRNLLVRTAARRAVAGRRGMIRTHPRCTIRARAGTVDPRADETVSPRAHVRDVLPRFMLCEGVDPWGAAVLRPSRRRSPGS